MVTRNLQTGPQNLPKSTPKSTKKSKNRAPTSPKWSQDGARRAPKSKKNIDPTKKRAASHSVPPFWWKKSLTWLKVGLQNRAKIDKKSIPKSIKNLMHLGIDFLSDFDGFLVPKWSQVGTKMGSKIDVNFERPILQKYL